jgi:hypothetical protein
MTSYLSFVADLGTFLAALAAVGSIWIGLHIYRQQVNAQVFLTYAQRYDGIMCGWPLEALFARFDSDTALPPRSAELKLGVLRYLNLCSEEFYLTSKGHLDRKVWRIWEPEIQRMIQTPLLKREWPDLRSEFSSYPQFVNYVERLQSEARSETSRLVS